MDMESKYQIQLYENGIRKTIPLPRIFVDEYMDMLNYVKNLGYETHFHHARPVIVLLIRDETENTANIIKDYIQRNIYVKSRQSNLKYAIHIASSSMMDIESAYYNIKEIARKNDLEPVAILLHPSVCSDETVSNNLEEISKKLPVMQYPELTVPLYSLIKETD